MAVDLKLYTEKVIELDEINAGQVRMNYGVITPVLIKNKGQDKAKDVIVSADAYNTLDELRQQYTEEVAQQKYAQQQQAASWKSFSLSEDGPWSTSLSVGQINANSFLEGTQTIEETFTKEEDCVLQDVWSYCLEEMSNNQLKIYKNEAKSQTAQRKSIDVGSVRDFQVTFKLDYDYDSTAYKNSNCLVIFPVRINSRGVGYILSFQFRAKDGKMYFGVYKGGGGMVDNLTRTYGTRFLDTNGFKSFDSTKLMGARIYTDANDNICFQFMLDGTWQTLYRSSNKSSYGTTMTDPDKTYPDAGPAYFDVGMYYGDLAVTLSNFSITTETDKQPVYIRSFIDANAIDGAEYKSAITLGYLEG